MQGILSSLHNLLNKSQFNLRKIVRTTIALRAQYRKIQIIYEKEPKLMENKNLYAKFLEIEEKMMENDLLTLDEVKYSQLLDNPDENKNSVMNFVKIMNK